MSRRSSLETNFMEEWLIKFYNETDPEKRYILLKENARPEENPEDKIRTELWILRFGNRSPNVDRFMGQLMELKSFSQGTRTDLTGKKRRQAEKILLGLSLKDIDKRNASEREAICLELKNTFLRYIDLCRNGRAFTSVFFGFGQLNAENSAKKVAEHLSLIAFSAPYALNMTKEFSLLSQAALQAFRQIYPNREHLLKKI